MACPGCHVPMDHQAEAVPTINLEMEAFRQPLIECLSVVPALLAQLVRSNVITIGEYEKVSNVLTQRGSRDGASLLLQLICKSGKTQIDAIPKFVCALQDSDDVTNAQLADLIQGNCNIPEFNKEHRLIKRHYHELQVLNPADVVPHLTYINPDDQHNILVKCSIGQSSLARSNMLHLTVRTLEPGWFEIFLHALEENGHGRVASLLRTDFQTEPDAMEDSQDGGIKKGLDSLSLDESHGERNYGQQNQGNFGTNASEMQLPNRRKQTCNQWKNRSRSSSSNTSTRRVSKSPKRRSTFKEPMKFGKKMRSKSTEGMKYINKQINVTVNITGSPQSRVVIGGEGNTINVGSQENEQKRPFAATPPGPGEGLHQGAQPGGEDEPDHAPMQWEEDAHDVHASPSPHKMSRMAEPSIPKTQRPNLLVDPSIPKTQRPNLLVDPSIPKTQRPNLYVDPSIPKTQRPNLYVDPSIPKTQRRNLYVDPSIPKTQRRNLYVDPSIPKTQRRNLYVDPSIPKTQRPNLYVDPSIPKTQRRNLYVDPSIPKTQRRNLYVDPSIPKTQRRNLYVDPSIPKTQRPNLYVDPSIPKTQRRNLYVDPSIPKTQRPNLFMDQLELAEDAVRGLNTVLVAPTGSGKTHVAAYIIHDHLTGDWPKPVNDRRVLFLVNTVNLVEQQADKLRELLQPSDFFSVVGIHGDSELSLQEEVATRKVIVLTAQLVENALSCIPLDRFSLLVFDECHLCQKGHAYNTIMSHYMDKAIQGNANMPQIIGMTASLGTGKAKDQSDADRHAVKICGNMNAHSISMVEREQLALEARVSIPKEVEPIEVTCRLIDPFADKINEIMAKIEIMLKSNPSLAMHRLVNLEKVPGLRGSQAYRQWCDRMKRNAQTLIQRGDEKLYRILQTDIIHLMEYNTALLINKQVRSKDAFDHLAKMMDDMNNRRTCFDDNDKKLWRIYVDEESALERIKEDPANENPLLEKLQQIILKEYQRRPHSRAILFVKTIDTTQALQDWIQETPELTFLNPGRIAGSRDMNSKQQNTVIEQFRRGDHKMLVATNLLEQGTDVPACNLVIRLDYIPSDFGHVQIKGRNRAKDGRSYLISLVDSRGATRDAANRKREVMMADAARYLKGMTQPEFLDLMQCQQRDDRAERQARQEQKADILQDNQDEVFIFCCINCSVEAFRSYDVRIYGDSQYLVIDPGFSKRMKIREHPKPKRLRHGLTIIGKMFCNRCGHDWGSLTRIRDSYYSSVKIARFSLKNLLTTEARSYKQWKNSPFTVQTVTELPLDARLHVPPDVLKKLRKL